MARQKILIQKASADCSHPYTMINIEAAQNAMRNLSPNAYKLYMLLALNTDRYCYQLSQTYITDALDMSKSTYIKAKKELIKKGYLYMREGIWDFYESLDEKSIVQL